MVWYAIKIIISAFLITIISEVSKRSELIGSIFASVPLVSILAMIWLYIDTKDTVKIEELSISIFWLVMSSLPFFLLLPYLLKKGVSFYASLGVSLTTMVLCYSLMVFILNKFGFNF